MDDPRDRDPLVYYPYVVVWIGCALCARKGSYRLARLAARYGAEIPLPELLRRLVEADCPEPVAAPRPSRALRGALHRP